DGFDPDEVMFDLDPPKPEVDAIEQIEKFKQREEEEKKALEKIAEKARKEYEDLDIDGFRPGKVVKQKVTVEEALKMPEA